MLAIEAQLAGLSLSRKVQEMFRRIAVDESYRSVGYVRRQVTALAVQAREAGDP